MKTQNVAVLGAAGHVGLGLTLSIADAGHHVFGIDINESALATIRAGKVPFAEEGGQRVLESVLERGTLTLTSDLSRVSECTVVIIVLGTPIDENLNPVLAPLHDLFRSLRPHLQKKQMIILRSTVSPGTTDSVCAALTRQTGWRVGEDIFVVYAPERVVQGKSLAEIRNLPQLIGSYDKLSFRKAQEFFNTFVANRCIALTPCEAELAKLMCNMARYMTFAISNEFYLVADQYHANIHRIMDACAYDYPRFTLPTPGINVAGPCLFKDGFFLAQWFPFPDLILTAFKINESMPVHVFRKIQAQGSIRKVGVLGLAFKAGNEDTRYSLSFKLIKLLEGADYHVVAVDPYVREHEDFSALRGCDAIVLMTPHPEFRDLGSIAEVVDNDRCWYVDVWGLWTVMRGVSENGCFRGREIPVAQPVAVLT